MLNMNRERTTIIIGKTGTGKTTKALELFDGEPLVKYANEYNIDDNYSIPLDKGILIEECHYKPNINIDELGVPKKIAKVRKYKTQRFIKRRRTYYF